MNLKECTPLHLAATYGHLEIFEDLRKAGANIFLLNDQQQSVLHKACQVTNHPLVVFNVSLSTGEPQPIFSNVATSENVGMGSPDNKDCCKIGFCHREEVASLQ